MIFSIAYTNAQNHRTMKENGFKKVNGINHYYEIYGAGKPLVLLHGGGGSIHNDFDEIIPDLEKHFKIIAIDLQNHGKSDHRSAAETFEQDAQDVKAVLNQLRVAKASFLGFSNGGTTVAKLAVLFPETVDKIIFCSALFKRNGMPSEFWEGFENVSLDMMPKSLRDNFLKLNPDQDKLQNMFNKDAQRMMNFKDVEDEILKTIKAKTLIVNGDNDMVLTSHALEINQLMPNSRLLIVPATHGSYLMADFDGKVHKELITSTVEIIKVFLKSL